MEPGASRNHPDILFLEDREAKETKGGTYLVLSLVVCAGGCWEHKVSTVGVLPDKNLIR